MTSLSEVRACGRRCRQSMTLPTPGSVDLQRRRDHPGQRAVGEPSAAAGMAAGGQPAGRLVRCQGILRLGSEAARDRDVRLAICSGEPVPVAEAGTPILRRVPARVGAGEFGRA